MSNVHHITKEGYEKKLAELEDLKNNKLPAVLEKLKSAIQQGDLSENAEYEQAMEEKSMIEKRISELEEFIKNAQIIDAKAPRDTVGYGNKVTIERDGRTETFEIVGSGEVDIFNNKISLDSPLGIAIKGKKIGETVIVDSPKGEYEVKIISIK